MSDSVSFDRAAEYYDSTRGIGDEAMARTVGLLAPELLKRGQVLEIGVGTGQMALPLHAAGVDVTGADISEAMLERLARKVGGRAPFPLVRGDATRLPFAEASFGAGYLRWVLHLVPAWHRALEELVRVVEPGGVVVVQLGNGSPGREGEIRRRCCDMVGVSEKPPGLDWGDTSTLDAAMAALGCDLRLMGPLRDESTERVSDFLAEIELGVYSWTWPIDEGSRRESVAAIRPWAQERWGPLDQEITVVHETYWRAYDLREPHHVAGGSKSRLGGAAPVS